jgi:hypothetical protein
MSNILPPVLCKFLDQKLKKLKITFLQIWAFYARNFFSSIFGALRYVGPLAHCIGWLQNYTELIVSVCTWNCLVDLSWLKFDFQLT